MSFDFLISDKHHGDTQQPFFQDRCLWSDTTHVLMNIHVKNYYVHYSYLDTKGNYDASIAINFGNGLYPTFDKTAAKDSRYTLHSVCQINLEFFYCTNKYRQYYQKEAIAGQNSSNGNIFYGRDLGGGLVFIVKQEMCSFKRC
ncbi:hypothetical protein M0804_008038 [Polistes exclamans]|nr:hypothetical protein M0804_008038 [Polistes exclamans]